MKKLISILIVILMLVGCTSTPDENETGTLLVKTDSDNYNNALPFDSNYLRFSHSGKDYMEIGKGLIELSKEHFSTDTYALKEGSIISDYNNDFRPLVKIPESQDNPYGLNPSSTSKLKINTDTEVTGPVLVSDILEVNFVENKNTEDIAGASFAIVLNKTIYNDDKQLVSVDDQVLYEFATEIVGPKLESYLRKNSDLNNAPILITVFVTDSANASVPGRYIAKAHYENRQGKFTPVNHVWALFPTEAGKKVDGLTNEQILSIKRGVKGFLPEDIGIVAYGEYYDDKLFDLKIEVNAQTKTYTEILALSHYIADLIMSFDSQSKVVVEIKSLNTTLAVIKRNANTSSAEVIMF